MSCELHKLTTLVAPLHRRASPPLQLQKDDKFVTSCGWVHILARQHRADLENCSFKWKTFSREEEASSDHGAWRWMDEMWKKVLRHASFQKINNNEKIFASPARRKNFFHCFNSFRHWKLWRGKLKSWWKLSWSENLIRFLHRAPIIADICQSSLWESLPSH